MHDNNMRSALFSEIPVVPLICTFWTHDIRINFVPISENTFRKMFHDDDYPYKSDFLLSSFLHYVQQKYQEARILSLHTILHTTHS